ncbi:MAG: hypothetical protein COS84_09280 [Armatimonadetes bacterium CG07_land_8_20_14_0_80_40_9]|nr:MAG: hypothetical protein COS84_09280 [Armatimonadetes bacterium CG07_land_8_20_14_0_80_40_9]
MEKSKSDFSKVAARVWQEEQLRETVEQLNEEINSKEGEIKRLKGILKEKEEIIEQEGVKFKTTLAEKDKTISGQGLKLKDSEETINNLKREINIWKNRLEEEKNKGLGRFIKGKLKK